jgi:hypothetical protein
VQFPLWGKGRYQISVAGIGPNDAGGKPRSEQAFGGFAVPYSPEYLRFKSDPLMLKQIADRTGGRLLTPEISTSSIPIAPPGKAANRSSIGFSSSSPASSRSTSPRAACSSIGR